MKIIGIALFCLTISCFGTAEASLVKGIQISADYFPDQTYTIGFDLAPNHLIQQVYFQEGEADPTFYTLADLSDFAPVFKVMGTNVVRMRIVQMDSPESGTIELQYRQNPFKRASIFFRVSFNENTGKYQIIDQRSGSVIHRAKVTTRYAGKVPVGIYSIDTQ